MDVELIQGDEILVWPDPQGHERGMALEPLHKNVPMVALGDAKMYAALTLVDAIGAVRVRERLLAERHHEDLLKHATESSKP